MNIFNTVCIWTAELFPLFATLAAFIYGLRHFFKKGRALYLQSITMAMGCHALGSLYHVCLTLTNDEIIEGFTPAFLGRIGFFLFFITASYGQMDKIVDDGSKATRPSRYIALVAPFATMISYCLIAMEDDIPLSTKIAYLAVWIPAAISLYYNTKHAIIPDLDFGFIKAIKPYNSLAVCLGISELFCLGAWYYYHPLWMAVSTIVFSVLCIATILAAKRGTEKWII